MGIVNILDDFVDGKHQIFGLAHGFDELVNGGAVMRFLLGRIDALKQLSNDAHEDGGQS